MHSRGRHLPARIVGNGEQQHVNAVRSTAALSIRQHRLVAYDVLACALAWWPWILYARGSSPAVIIGFGPFLAAMIVLAFTEGKQGVYELLRRMIQWRVHPSWYALALLLPIVISTDAAMLNILL